MNLRPPSSTFATSRPVAVLVVFVAAVVFGYFSYGRLPVRLMPELSYPTITVRTEYPGAAPEEVEKDVSRPIEEALGVISGLRRISSISRADVSDVVLEFAWDTEMSEAVQDTLEKLDLVILPEDAGASLILRFDPSLDPVMELSLSTTRGGGETEAEQRRLRRLGELQIKRRLEPIKGVAAVRVRGGLEEEIHVRLEAARLSRAGLSIADVIRRLEEENVNIAGGTIKEGRADYMVRTVNEFEDLDQIRDTLLTIIDGREVRVRDVGSVDMSHHDREMVTRTDGGPSVQIDVFKEADANIVSLAARVRAAVGVDPREIEGVVDPSAVRSQQGLAEELFLSEDALLDVVADRSVFIESSIDEVRNTAIIGGFLAVLVLFLFLGEVRSTLIIGVSIPISLLVTFAPLNLLGVSLNIMSLGGLALGIGMLVDSSIVVLESIYRNREEGHDVVDATIRGTRDVAGAVTASTLTTIGVFLPMVFVDGVAGQAFDDLGLAVVLSLSVSLIVALFFIPMLASRRAPARGRASADHEASQTGGKRPWWMLAAWQVVADDWRSLGWLGRIVLSPYFAIKLLLTTVLELVGRAILLVLSLPRLSWRYVGKVVRPAAKGLVWLPLLATRKTLEVCNRVYPRVIAWAVDHVGAVLLMSAVFLGVLYMSVVRLDSELLPEVFQGEFTLEVALPVGTPLEATEDILEPVEKAILAEREHIDTLIVQLGYDATDAQSFEEGEHTARFKVLLVPSRDNEATEREVAARIRAKLDRIPDLEARLVRPVLFSFKTPIEVEVYGDDLRELRIAADRVRDEMEAMGLLTDVEATLRKGAPEVLIEYDRERLLRYGLEIGDVARQVRDQVRGRSSTRYNVDDRRIPIVVRLRDADRASVDDIQRLVVDPKGSGQVTLGAIAGVQLGEGPSEVRRVDGRRVAVVRANLEAGATLGGAVTALEERLAESIEWPDGLTWAVAGQSEEWERSQSSLLIALALSIFLVYVVMAAQFESLLYPLIIMASIPLAFVGTFVTVLAIDMSISIVVFLGMIMLAGIVVNNAIVLVDYVNILKRRGMKTREAVIQGGVVRLRPILMTTATTVLGLLPMAIGLGDGAEIRRPLAITVISGLVVSTALTLVVIPTLYMAADQARERVFAVFGRTPDDDRVADDGDEESSVGEA
jgi:HAE1 family hydrophobic/amphiphilic exporter-1